MITVLARHLPGFGAYGDLLDFVGRDLGHGRVADQVEQALAQHLIILRRIMVQEAGLNFSEVDIKSGARLKRAKLGSFGILGMAVVSYALFLVECRGEPAMWNEIKGMF